MTDDIDPSARLTKERDDSAALHARATIGWEADRSKVEKMREAIAVSIDALQRAQAFIRNGVYLGFIRMPDASTPDAAHDTPPVIDAALVAARAAYEETGP